jgi:plastocyanin
LAPAWLQAGQGKVEAGDVVFFLHALTSDFSSPHNFHIGPEIGQPIAFSPDVDPGDSIVFTVHDLSPGTYTYWCTYDDH